MATKRKPKTQPEPVPPFVIVVSDPEGQVNPERLAEVLLALDDRIDTQESLMESTRVAVVDNCRDIHSLLRRIATLEHRSRPWWLKVREWFVSCERWWN